MTQSIRINFQIGSTDLKFTRRALFSPPKRRIKLETGSSAQTKMIFTYLRVLIIYEHFLCKIHNRENQILPTALVAQWIEQWIPNPCAACSIHAEGTIKLKTAIAL